MFSQNRTPEFTAQEIASLELPPGNNTLEILALEIASLKPPPQNFYPGYNIRQYSHV